MWSLTSSDCPLIHAIWSRVHPRWSLILKSILFCFNVIWQLKSVLQFYFMPSNIIIRIDFGHFCNLQKLAISRMFHLEKPGYWFQFSTSNNTISLFDHWLVYRHCAKLLIYRFDEKYFRYFSFQNHCNQIIGS